MPPAGFEPTIPASKLSQTRALDCAATGIGKGQNTESEGDAPPVPLQGISVIASLKEPLHTLLSL